MDKIPILVADDSVSVRTYLSKLLVEWGYEVTVCSSGDAARQILRKEYFPIIILDWIMPGVSGTELCKEIRSNSLKRYQYIMILTGKNTKDDLIEGLNAGADDFLVKPFATAELKVRLNTAMRSYNYEQELKNREHEARVQVYHTLTELAEKRDMNTGSHLERIPDLALMLGEAVNLNHETLAQLWLFSPMHDIGKVGISDEILRQPRKLTKEEFKVMQTHTIIGWEILREKPTLEMAAEIAYTHHEKWDGSGYPRKLRGNEIPISGRIVSIVDVYDALRSERPYKKAFSHEESMQIILKNSDKAFDPALIVIFQSIEKDMEDLFDKKNLEYRIEVEQKVLIQQKKLK